MPELQWKGDSKCQPSTASPSPATSSTTRCFGRRADALSRYLAKGSLAMVQGHLRQLTYTDRQGQRRSKVEVMVDEIEWRSRRQGDAATAA